MSRSGLLYYISLTIALFILLRVLPEVYQDSRSPKGAHHRAVYHGLLKVPPGVESDSSSLRPPHINPLEAEENQKELEMSRLRETSRQVILHPGDIPAQPYDDSALFDEEFVPVEPRGTGTLRDVRYLLPFPCKRYPGHTDRIASSDPRFYRGGLYTLNHPPHAVIYDPYPDYNSPEWQKSWKGKFQACEGPHGRALSRKDSEDMMSVFPGNQEDFPRPKVGGYDAMGLDGEVCTDRYSRYAAYGYGENHQNVRGVFIPPPRDWESVNWATLQAKCYSRNSDRYALGRDNLDSVLALPSRFPFAAWDEQTDVYKRSGAESAAADHAPRHHPRSAMLIRVWHQMEWTPNLIHYVRSVIMELSLHSGGEYEVFILVDVKDDIPIHNNDGTAEKIKKLFIPAEFHDISILFNNMVLQSWYPDVEEHEAKFQHFQAIQIFSELYPQFEYYWQIEVDARFTGHTYHFLDKAIEFAKQQPRKYLWERNAYHYVREAHGPWETFMQMVDESMVGLPSVWGPVAKEGVTPIGPKPPVDSPTKDNYSWGVGEEADMITFLPVFDPTNTDWTFPNMLWNLDPMDTPRRTSVITMSRASRRLLHEIHKAQVHQGWGVVSEMTLSTFALWHGLKAVHVPHPVHVDGQWTPKELARIMNPGEPEKINGGPDSFWNYNEHALDHIVYRTSFMYSAQTAEDLFRRWMGYEVDPNEFTNDQPHQDIYGRNWFDSGDLREDLFGRLCYPSLFLHPIKNVELEKGSMDRPFGVAL
ncbi:uncharacterized protein N7459_003787 [Penicillium hispanicum]|uniref:uncharacterized protein n=1 Tax=Penicillium hispanicum TaxID=1080232 RepID=UPI002541502F|nr:uncharacterized protein N7459_003787 [Penicillium hispanicum]KAJ5583987.1 hypothetical protein N7459_003787 [Penicillium hispanicum]